MVVPLFSQEQREGFTAGVQAVIGIQIQFDRSFYDVAWHLTTYSFSFR